MVDIDLIGDSSRMDFASRSQSGKEKVVLVLRNCVNSHSKVGSYLLGNGNASPS